MLVYIRSYVISDTWPFLSLSFVCCHSLFLYLLNVFHTDLDLTPNSVANQVALLS